MLRAEVEALPAPAVAPEMRECAHIKRLLELLEGDPDFRARAAAGTTPYAQLAADAGLDLPAADLAPFFQAPEVARSPLEAQQEWREAFAANPLGQVWTAWAAEDTARLKAFISGLVPTHPRARAWRARRLARARSDAVGLEDVGYFPLLAFELSEGCSVQCWFCALDPGRLAGVFAYTAENRRLWREVLGHAWALFGAGCRSAMCYHGTDPADNPDYFRFQEDVVDIFGVLPQVTTSQPLRDPAWTRTLLDMQRQHPDSHHRFSVLSLGMLRRIHQAFSPEELLQVSLVMQHKEALGRRVECGRAASRPDRLAAEAGYRQAQGVPEAIERQTTCECTCGYLVNMVSGRIQLIRPATPSARAPRGFETLAEGCFRDGQEFRAFLERTVADHMPEHLGPDQAVRFWDDVRYERLPEGFALTSRFRVQTLRGNAHLGRLGDLIHAGSHTTSQITDALIEAGMPVLDAVAALDRAYQSGVLAEG